jgi:uncharacterized protein YbjT (DUF2867 family)
LDKSISKTAEETAMKVLMVGVTGKYASFVLPELKKRGARVRALVRAENEAAARENGADEIAIGDLRDPVSLRAAARGVDGVFHIGPAFAPDESNMGVAMVEAAKAAGVGKFVFSGVIHPSSSKLSNHAAKLPVEQAIYESGMNFAVLQPAMFMQTIEMGWNEVLNEGHFSLPYSKHVKACYVDYRDVAEVAALALTTNRLDYGTFELCAPGQIDRVGLAALMSEILGRRIEAGELSQDEWARKSGIPDERKREGLRRMYAHYNQYGFPGGNSLILRTIIAREPRTLKQFLHELAVRSQKAA